jgi:zinc protease
VKRTFSASSAFLLASALVVVAIAVAGAVQEPDRTRPPKPGPPPRLVLPDIQKQSLSNGLPVWIVEHHEVPLAQVHLVIRSGGAADPRGKFGAAALAAAMLDEGAGSRSALELADAIDFLGAELAASSSFDQSRVRLSVPVARLSDALSLMADVVLRPTFPDAEIDRVRKERLTQLLQVRDDPEALIGLAFPRIVFGTTYRYGTPAVGSEPTLKALTRHDLLSFYRAHYRPDNATLLIVGDVSGAIVMPLVERAFGGWKTEGPRPAAGDLEAAPQLRARRVYIVDKPGAAQSQIRIGWVGVSRTVRDEATVDVLNTILGGSFTSRLNTNLREQHGYAYGAYSRFDRRRAPGPFFAGAGVQTDKTADALKECFKELDGMLNVVPEDELERAKHYLALGFPGEFETTSDLASKLEEIAVYSLPDDTFATYIERVQKVTGRDIQQAAARLIQPRKLAVVIVGDRKTIEPSVRALRLGPVTIVPTDEIFK